MLEDWDINILRGGRMGKHTRLCREGLWLQVLLEELQTSQLSGPEAIAGPEGVSNRYLD